MKKRVSEREWKADVYHRVSRPQASWGKKVLAKLALRGDETVLDAGCGSGRLTAELLEGLPSGHVVALDLSRNMLSTARSYLAERFGSRVSLIAADLEDLPFSRRFDGVFSTAALHWVLDQDRMFRELFRCLRPGGWLRAQCGGKSNLERLLGRVRKLASSGEYAGFFVNYPEPWVFNDAETAAVLLRNAGFVEVETGLEAAPTTFDGEAEYVEFVGAVVLRVHLERIPDAALRSQFVAELVRQAARDDPPFSLDYWRLNISAKVP